MTLPSYAGRPLQQQLDDETVEERRREERCIRWCRHCQAHKPDRTHHCRVLGQCVERFDHHCPWMGNTVGWNNHKYFILFCSWCAVLCFFALGGIMAALSVRVSWDFLAWGAVEVQMGVVGFVCFLFGLTLGGFAGLHVWLLRRNQTTLENMKDDRRWDLGDAAANVRQLLGPRSWRWLVPVERRGVGVGVEFEQQQQQQV